jgi:hypothetical protein
MVLQAWGAYASLWPVVHQQLGVSPDMGRRLLEVVPQLPAGQSKVAAGHIRVGTGAIDVSAVAGNGTAGNGTARKATLRTTVTGGPAGTSLLIGQVLPAGAKVATVTLDGRPVAATVRQTARGTEVVAEAGSRGGTSTLVITLS